MQHTTRLQTCKAWALVVLLLSHRAIAARFAVEETASHDRQEPSVDGNVRHQALLDREEAGQLSCQDLPHLMALILDKCAIALTDATRQRVLDGQHCRELPQNAMRVAALTWIADRHHCLPEMMSAVPVREQVDRLINLWGRIPGSALSRESRRRMERAKMNFDNWQDDLLIGASSILDRRLVIASNVEDPDVCPEPCLRCQKRGSSTRTDDHFSFKCVLSAGTEPPTRHDMNCSEPEPREGAMGHIFGERKSWCDVHGWRRTAEQTAAISASITCASLGAIGPLQHGREMPESVRETCVDGELGRVVPRAKLLQFRDYAGSVDSVVSSAERSAFSVFMSIGIARGLAALRMAARGNAQHGTEARASLAQQKAELVGRQLAAETSLESGGGWNPHSDGDCLPRADDEPFDGVGRVLLSVCAGTLGSAAGGFLAHSVAVGTSAVFFEALTSPLSSLALTMAPVQPGFFFLVAAGIYVGRRTWSMLGTDTGCEASTVDHGGSPICVAPMRFGVSVTLPASSVPCGNGTGAKDVPSITVSCNESDGGIMTIDRLPRVDDGPCRRPPLDDGQSGS